MGGSVLPRIRSARKTLDGAKQARAFWRRAYTPTRSVHGRLVIASPMFEDVNGSFIRISRGNGNGGANLYVHD